ncbi:DUF6221 family protein [Streptomyces sp. NPDC029554]|uniref:DUF6221 family protein n=1 Tax=Streptomyces sp. NPDC029554 TaxID=3155126 RepID=UPI0033D7D89C
MDELVRWLGEQLDEDERIARAVRVPHDWHQGPGDDDPEWVGDEMVLMWPPEFHTPYEQDKHWRGLTVEGSELAAHIARHDPARVLRENDAKRAVVERYERAMENSRAHPDDLASAGALLALHGVVKLIALPYADRPGFRDEWRP